MRTDADNFLFHFRESVVLGCLTLMGVTISFPALLIIGLVVVVAVGVAVAVKYAMVRDSAISTNHICFA